MMQEKYFLFCLSLYFLYQERSSLFFALRPISYISCLSKLIHLDIGQSQISAWDMIIQMFVSRTDPQIQHFFILNLRAKSLNRKSIRTLCIWITTFMLLLVNNVVQKIRVTNTISLYKLTNAFLLLICFKLVMKSMKLCQF